jgi:transposase-like protein
MNLVDITKMFPTDEKCRELLTRLRWPEAVRCPRCNMDAVELETEKTLYYCKDCDYQFSVTAGTIFNDSHLPLTKWFLATLLLCEAKKGMSACQVQRTLGISYKTAWYLCHRIRAAMVQVDRPMLSGKIEVDETYVGGKGTGLGQRGRGTKKRPVIGMVPSAPKAPLANVLACQKPNGLVYGCRDQRLLRRHRESRHSSSEAIGICVY